MGEEVKVWEVGQVDGGIEAESWPESVGRWGNDARLRVLNRYCSGLRGIGFCVEEEARFVVCVAHCLRWRRGRRSRH